MRLVLVLLAAFAIAAPAYAATVESESPADAGVPLADGHDLSDVSATAEPVSGELDFWAIVRLASSFSFENAPEDSTEVLAPVPLPAASVLLFGAVGLLGLIKARRSS